MFTELKANLHLAHLAQAFAPAAARREAYGDCIEPVLAQLQRRHASAACATIDVGVTSTCAGEGVSTIAYHLARLAAESHPGDVVLVRASARPTDFVELADDSGRPGLQEVLQGDAQLDQCIRRVVRTELDCLALGGSRPGHRPFALHRAAGLLAELRRRYEFVVVDLPCVSEPGPCLRLAGLLSGVILTVEAERLRSAEIENSCKLLRLSGATILGVVLNKHRGDALPRRAR